MSAAAMRRAVVTALLVAAMAFALAAVLPPSHAFADEDAAAARHAYSARVAKTYNYRTGLDRPFLPSNATTDTGEFLDPQTFPTAAYCGHCHQQSLHQWRESAHANSFRAPWYIKNVGLLMQQKGFSYARHCEGCHNPIALTSGSLTDGVVQKRPTDDDGITCSVCHSIQSVDQRGTGSYVLAQPAVLVDEAGKPIYGKVSDVEIMAHLDRHSQAVMKPFYRTAGYCTSCHKAALPATLNDYKWQRAIFLSDEWQMSSFAKQSPLPFYSKPAVATCQTCHMGKDALTLPDPGAKDGRLASHRWVGANTLLPTYYRYPEQLEKTKQFLQHDNFNIDLFALEIEDKQGSARTVAPLGTQPFSLRGGDLVTASVVIQNKGIAHSHVPEQRDMYESWVAFTVKDDAGRAVYRSGFLQPDGSLDEGAHSFTNRLIDKDGNLNGLHQVWNNRVVAYNNTIQSGRSQIVRYRFRVPAAMSTGALHITAEVEYRRFDRRFLDFGLGKHAVQPVVTMAARERMLRIGDNPADPVPDLPSVSPVSALAPVDNPLWMRWNNYGIGLLDAQQYAAAVDAFEQVARLRPDYADAYTNIALADFQWERYDAARSRLERALQLAPGNARALYYLALVERNQGHLDAAIEDLRRVVSAYPESRDAHRELGFSFYQQQRYAEARREYGRVQAIDPDDLAAHYILSIVYRRLGLKQQAAVEAAQFADQKDDPAANAAALQYLAAHGEVAAESVPWHVHGEASPRAALRRNK